MIRPELKALAAGLLTLAVLEARLLVQLARLVREEQQA